MGWNGVHCGIKCAAIAFRRMATNVWRIGRYDFFVGKKFLPAVCDGLCAVVVERRCAEGFNGFLPSFRFLVAVMRESSRVCFCRIKLFFGVWSVLFLQHPALIFRCPF